MDDVGLIGCGNIGGRIAGVLRDKGWDLRVFDLDRARAAATGGDVVERPTDLADLPIVLVSLPSSVEVEAVMDGPDGLIARGVPGLRIVDLTTADPSSTRHLHAAAATRGIGYVDAGVTGGAAVVGRGEAVLLVGGEDDDIAAVQPVLASFSAQVLPMGGPGTGHAAKAVNNVLNAVTLAATGEAMLAGVEAGLDPIRLLEAINAGSGSSWASRERFPKIVAGEEMAGGLSVALMAKDVDVFLRLAEQSDTPTEIAEACVAVYRRAIDRGYGDEVANAVVQAMGDGVPLHERGGGQD